MRIFIVYSHPEPKSLNGAMLRTARETLTSAGHEVVVSDLYAMKFDPVSDRKNFTTVLDANYYRQQPEEAHAAAHDGFAPDLKAEMDKLFWCDLLILQFPMWWFGLPAMLKGWIDRVFAFERVYGFGKRFDKGVLVGKRAMCALTTGGLKPSFSAHGLSGPIDMLLFPINHGMLYFTGFTVIEPFIIHGAARRSDEERKAELERFRERLLSLDTAPTISYPKLDDYDERFVLKEKSKAD